MSSVEPSAIAQNSIEFELSRYERIIDTLTARIHAHRNQESKIKSEGLLYALHRKKFYEWRRVSIALHRKRSELKMQKDKIGKAMEKTLKAGELFPH
jgi:hypothetical protein